MLTAKDKIKIIKKNRYLAKKFFPKRDWEIDIYGIFMKKDELKETITECNKRARESHRFENFNRMFMYLWLARYARIAGKPFINYGGMSDVYIKAEKAFVKIQEFHAGRIKLTPKQYTDLKEIMMKVV